MILSEGSVIALMKILIQLAFLWVVWLISPRRWRRLIMLPLSAIAISLIGVSSWGVQLALWGLTVWLPPDTGEYADVIVVLGRGEALRDLRTGVAYELWRGHRAPQIFASGMMDARAIVKNLKELGVPSEYLTGEECSQSTQENALFSATLMKPYEEQRIILVTDASHMLRSVLIFRRNGFQVLPHAIPLPSQWTILDRQRCLLREYLALTQYVWAGSLAKPIPKNLITSPVEVAEKIRAWNCWVQGTT